MLSLPTALVGSISVIYLVPILEQLLSKVGVEFAVFKARRLKDMSWFWRGPTAEESEKFQSLINEIYDNFVSVVAQARNLEETKVRDLATGEVVTGLRVVTLRLVDQIGDFEYALNAGAAAANAKPRPKWLQPKRGQRLMRRSSAGQTGLDSLTEGLQRILAGGIYCLKPSHMARGEYQPQS